MREGWRGRAFGVRLEAGQLEGAPVGKQEGRPPSLLCFVNN